MNLSDDDFVFSAANCGRSRLRAADSVKQDLSDVELKSRYSAESGKLCLLAFDCLSHSLKYFMNN